MIFINMIRLKSLLEQREIFPGLTNITSVAEQNSKLLNELENKFQKLGNPNTSNPSDIKVLNYSSFQKYILNADNTLLYDTRLLANQLQTLSKFVSDTTQNSYKELKVASDNFTQKNQLPSEQSWTSYEREITRQGGPQLGTRTKWLKNYFMKKPSYLLDLLLKINGNENAAKQSAVAFAKDDSFRKAYMSPLSGAWQSIVLGDPTLKSRVESTLSQLNQGYYEIASTEINITPVTNLNDGINFILA